MNDQPTTVRPTTVHLVRHGEVHNPGAVLYGRLPGFDLSDRGRAMAQRVGAYLADRPIDVLATSPLERARQTTAPIAAAHPDVEVQVQPLLIEARNDFEGQVFGPRLQALRDPRNWPKLRNPLRPSWGEPFSQVASRMRTAIQVAAAQAGPGGQAVLVSHQLPIWIARRDAEGKPLVHDPRRRQCILASITSLHLQHGRVVGIDYAEPALDLIPVKDRAHVFSSGSNDGPR